MSFVHLNAQRLLLNMLPGILLLFLFSVLFLSCSSSNPSGPEYVTYPEHEKRYGIYSFDMETEEIELIYTSDYSIHRIHENSSGTRIVFQQNFGDDVFLHSEICTINPDGTGYRKLTDNSSLDAYPSWSPDGSRIVYLSWPEYPDNTLDIYTMNSDGSSQVELYDSGYHDADCYWSGSKIVFTRESQIWIMDDDGTSAVQVTDFELAGEQGSADLPFGDYDPRLEPNGSVILFDRMVDDQHPSGNWNFYTINVNGTGESAITDTGWQQFIAEWSHSGNLILFTVASMNDQGVYDLYTVNPDGSNTVNITPANWPTEFLCSHGVFSHDDAKIYFTGEWWD